MQYANNQCYRGNYVGSRSGVSCVCVRQRECFIDNKHDKEVPYVLPTLQKLKMTKSFVLLVGVC